MNALEFLRAEDEKKNLFFYYSALFIFLLVFARYRWVGVIEKEVWSDEWGQIALLGRDSFSSMWSTLHPTLQNLNNNQTGFSYVLTWICGKIFGPFEFALRLPNYLCGLGIIFFSAEIVRKVSGKIPGIIAALYFGLSEWQIFFAKEARVYSEFAFLIILILYFIVLYIFSKNKKFLYAAFVSSFLCLLATPQALLAVPACFILIFSGVGNKKDFLSQFKLMIIVSIFTLIVYFCVAKLTYSANPMDGNSMKFNPFEFIHSWREIFREVLRLVFNQNLLLYLILFLLASSLNFFGRQRERNRTKLAIPIILFLISMSVLILSIIATYLKEYWILSRQWYFLHAPFQVAIFSFFYLNINAQKISALSAAILIVTGCFLYRDYDRFKKTPEFNYSGENENARLEKVYAKFPEQKYYFVSSEADYFMKLLACQGVYTLNHKRTLCPFMNTWYGIDPQIIPENVFFSDEMKSFKGIIIARTEAKHPLLNSLNKKIIDRIVVYYPKELHL
ncbi:MAG: glycosyltransferase family 39 protein [Leptospira sp.]|nr:glycosyltransferase family 39 protein [Leptospira sp.]